jgi:hypothetical protein
MMCNNYDGPSVFSILWPKPTSKTPETRRRRLMSILKDEMKELKEGKIGSVSKKVADKIKTAYRQSRMVQRYRTFLRSNFSN